MTHDTRLDRHFRPTRRARGGLLAISLKYKVNASNDLWREGWGTSSHTPSAVLSPGALHTILRTYRTHLLILILIGGPTLDSAVPRGKPEPRLSPL